VGGGSLTVEREDDAGEFGRDRDSRGGCLDREVSKDT
jgi:hypothetical protein